MSAKFHITAQGDRTTGDGDHYACVDIPDAVEDVDYIAFVREQLETCFTSIFDAKARAWTDKEFQEMSDDSEEG